MNTNPNDKMFEGADSSSETHPLSVEECLGSRLRVELTELAMRQRSDYLKGSEVTGLASNNRISTLFWVDGWSDVGGELEVDPPALIREASSSAVVLREKRTGEGRTQRALMIDLAPEYFDALCNHALAVDHASEFRIGRQIVPSVTFVTQPAHNADHKSGVTTIHYEIVSMALSGRPFEGESRLNGLVTNRGSDHANNAAASGAPNATIPHCPRCGKEMVRRTAQVGRNAGYAFWGCQQFPSCRGTRAYY